MRSIPGFDPEKMGFPPLDPAMILTAAAAGMDPSAMIPLGGPGVPHQRMGGGGFDGGFRGRGRGRGGMGGRGGGRGGGMHGMGTRPSIDQLPQLVIDKIPLESCTIDKVNDYFKQFGNIVNIQLAIQQQQAIIEFSQITEARAAFSSPEVIFNNRFVKVYWYKPEEHQMRQQQQYPHGNQHPLNPNIYNHHQQQQPENSGEENGNNASQNDNGSSIGDSSQAEAGAAAAAPAFNVYAAMEEKKKREQDAVRNMLDIQKQKEQLIQKQIEQQKMMMQQLQKSNMSTSEKAEILKKLKELADKTRDVLSSSVTESASVKAKSAQMVASTPGAVATASSSTTSIPPSMSSSPVDGQSNIEITTSTDEDMADPVLLAQLDSLKKQV